MIDSMDARCARLAFAAAAPSAAEKSVWSTASTTPPGKRSDASTSRMTPTIRANPPCLVTGFDVVDGAMSTSFPAPEHLLRLRILRQY